LVTRTVTPCKAPWAWRVPAQLLAPLFVVVLSDLLLQTLLMHRLLPLIQARPAAS
jgi:hypothetical protein